MNEHERIGSQEQSGAKITIFAPRAVKFTTEADPPEDKLFLRAGETKTITSIPQQRFRQHTIAPPAGDR